MWIRLLGSIGLYKLIIFTLSKSQVIPDDTFWRIMEDFPVLAIILLVIYYQQKTYMSDATVQREALKEVYDTNHIFLSELINQIKAKQDEMSANIKYLADRHTNDVKTIADQLSINTATVNEIAVVNSIMSELITRIEKK